MTELPRHLRERLDFPFPAGEVHAGIPLGNGTFGALLWGGGRSLRVTINRADYWDHRGGVSFSPEATYANLREWLKPGPDGVPAQESEARLRETFGEKRSEPNPGSGPQTPPRATRLPMGRVDLQLPVDWEITGGGLHLHRGEAEIELQDLRRQGKARAMLLRETPVLCLRITGVDGREVAVQSVPPDAPAVKEHFRRYGFPPPERFDFGELGGWVQECPEEPSMAVAWLRHDSPAGLMLYVTSVYGPDPAAARKEALRTLEGARAESFTPAALRASADWQRWWEQAATVALPDPTLELLYYTGMYRLAAATAPDAPALTLQGPWVEDHRLPPWSGDYHFNINVQQCYWPCLAGNHPELLLPLARMVERWTPKLRANARTFTGVTDGLQLPHSTDDRGASIGGFWTGLVDHGATAWTAQLFWLYYRHTLDRDFLRDTAYPFLRGSLRVYEAMLEEGPDGRPGLPVSVSPEYGAAGITAHGRNASFQLALIHFLCRALLQASAELGIDEEQRAGWTALDARLPLGAIGGIGDAAELLLWEGQPLEESHRHHSHLAGLYPFDIFDLHGSEAQRRLVANSLERWTRLGMGQWTGWCVPWAAILHARLGNGDSAVWLLETFRRFFLTPGYASTHDARLSGLTVMDRRPDVMQLDAGLGGAAAVLELLVHTAGGVLKVFPAVPAAWETASFARVRAEGAFVVAGERSDGRTARIEILSEAGSHLRLANPWGGGACLIRRNDGPAQRTQGRILELPTQPGERLVLEPA